MKTATSLISSATVAAAATDGAGHVQVDLNALTVNTAVISITTVTDSTTSPGIGKQIDIMYAFSPNAITASTAPAQLAGSVNKVTVTLENGTSLTREYFSAAAITLNARYMYVWYKQRGMDGPVTLTVQLIS